MMTFLISFFLMFFTFFNPLGHTSPEAADGVSPISPKKIPQTSLGLIGLQDLLSPNPTGVFTRLSPESPLSPSKKTGRDGMGTGPSSRDSASPLSPLLENDISKPKDTACMTISSPRERELKAIQERLETALESVNRHLADIQNALNK